MKPSLAAWARDLSLTHLQEFADLFADVRDLEAQWAELAGDTELADPGTAAQAVYGDAIRRAARRLNTIVAAGFSSRDVLPRAADLARLLEALVFIRAAMGLATPQVRPLRKPTKWWEEPAGDGEGFRYLVEIPGKVDRTQGGGVGMMWATKWSLATDDWKFEVSGSGELIRATRK
jgi:hypothetical protein